MFFDKYLISAPLFLPFMTVAKDSGVAEAKLFAGTNLTSCDFLDPAKMLTRTEQFTFLNNILANCDTQSLGVSAGLMADFKTLGILGLAMLSASTLQRSLEIGVKFAPIGGALGDISYLHEGNRVGLEINYPPVATPLLRMLVEEQFLALQIYATTTTATDCHPKTGSECIAEEIHFSYEAPQNKSVYEELFRCKLVFSAPSNQIWYRSDLLNQTPLLANEMACDMCIKLCEDELSKSREENPLIVDIAKELRIDAANMPSLEEMASRLKLSKRTLRRQIADLGGSYSALISATRYEIAIDLLTNSRLSIAQVGERLGYVEATNFRRAFKRWSGLSPKDYRQTSKH